MVEVKGKPWGVIVIDSGESTLAAQSKIEKFYAKNAKMIGKLLERL